MYRKVITALIALTTALAATAAATAASASAAPIRKAATSPPLTQLSSVSCVTPKFCLALAGGAVAEKWNGVTWKHVAVQLPATGSLARMSCVTTTFCMAVGSYTKGAGRYGLAEAWNGKAWKFAEPPTTNASSTSLAGVSCVSVKSCVAVGAYTKNGATFALGESWNGRRWAMTRPIVPARAGLNGLDGVSCVRGTSYCVAAGYYSSGVNPLIESWNGRNWKRMQAAPFPAGISGGALTGISCASVKSCAAVGYFQYPEMLQYLPDVEDVEEVWNGKSWTLTSAQLSSPGLTSLLSRDSCVAASHCVAVGYANDFYDGYYLGVATWNGSAWAAITLQSSGVNMGAFNDVSCLSVNYCVAVGWGWSGGLAPAIAVSGIWNGKTWKLVNAP